jgi:hypothetical protein
MIPNMNHLQTNRNPSSKWKATTQNHVQRNYKVENIVLWNLKSLKVIRKHTIWNYIPNTE